MREPHGRCQLVAVGGLALEAVLPAGNRFLNSANGNSVKGGSLLSENSSLSPKSLSTPLAEMSKIFSPPGRKISNRFHSLSESAKICRPASPSVELSSISKRASSNGCGYSLP